MLVMFYHHLQNSQPVAGDRSSAQATDPNCFNISLVSHLFSLLLLPFSELLYPFQLFLQHYCQLDMRVSNTFNF